MIDKEKNNQKCKISGEFKKCYKIFVGYSLLVFIVKYDDKKK